VRPAKHADHVLTNIHLFQAGRQWFIRSALVSSLPDDIINQTVLQFADTPVGCSMCYIFLVPIVS